MDEQALTAPEGLVVGCSGYDYPEWRGRFYPEDLQKRAWLGYYAERFRGGGDQQYFLCAAGA